MPYCTSLESVICLAVMGKFDNYGFGLLAQPNRSLGQPVMRAGSQPISIIGLPSTSDLPSREVEPLKGNRVFYPMAAHLSSFIYYYNSYDAQGRLEEIINWKKIVTNNPPIPEQDVISSYSYSYDYDHQNGTWDKKGYRTSLIENVYGETPVQRDEQYYYDSRYQLIKTKYLDIPAEYNWAYDDIGNRISQTKVPDSSTSYSYYQIGSSKDSQLLRHDGSECYIWDEK